MILWIHNLIGAVRRNAFLRKCLILLWYVLGISLSYYLAFYLRFDGAIPARFMDSYRQTLPAMILINVLVFAFFRLYSGIWAYFDIDDAFRIGRALGVSFILFFPTVCILLTPVTAQPDVVNAPA